MVKVKMRQHGFAVLEVVIIVVVVLVLSFIAWWIFADKKEQSANNQSKNVVTGPLTTEDRNKLAAEAAEGADSAAQTTSGDAPAAPPSPNSSPTVSEKQNTSPSPSSQSPSNSSSQSATNNTQTTPVAAQPSGYIRPTTAYCQEKDGNSFTAWTTDNSSHTYQVYESGNQVSKTEAGTAARNFDTMQVVGVIPYHTQAAWATCSSKSGYISFYYKPSGSVYTYNWLVSFEHITVAQP